MAFKFLDGSSLVCRLHDLIRRVGSRCTRVSELHCTSKLLTLISPPIHLAPCPHFSSMVSRLCLLATYSAVPGGYQIHLDKHLTIAIIEFFIDVDTAIHLGRLDYFSFCIAFRPGSMPQTFSPQTIIIPEIAAPIAKCNPADLSRSKGTGEDRQAHPDFLVPPVLGFGIYLEKSAVKASTPSGSPCAPTAYPCC